MKIDFRPVLCTLSECYQPELGAMVGRNATAIQISIIILYMLLFIRIRTADKQRTSASFSFTRRIFNSLAVIVLFVLVNLLFNVLALQILPGLKLSKLVSLHVSLMTGYLPNIAGATHAVVLYVFSNEYRKAFRVYICDRSKVTPTTTNHTVTNNPGSNASRRSNRSR
ncbi:serpentine type 7TM GPCR chemoreceptor srsx domain-containing protein [Ditylenchus destructor]|nr:serpentine type 7TM GPCR chemoreceptor srsx domain-containing protein [Ditylenchus destructor]